jgi:hypothetical protein
MKLSIARLSPSDYSPKAAEVALVEASEPVANARPVRRKTARLECAEASQEVHSVATSEPSSPAKRRWFPRPKPSARERLRAALSAALV